MDELLVTLGKGAFLQKLGSKGIRGFVRLSKGADGTSSQVLIVIAINTKPVTNVILLNVADFIASKRV